MKARGAQGEARGCLPLVLQGSSPCFAFPIPCWERSLRTPEPEGLAEAAPLVPCGFSAAPSAIPSSPRAAFVHKVIPSIPTGAHLLRRGFLGLVLCKLIWNHWDGMQSGRELLEPEMKRVGLHTRLGCSVYLPVLVPQWHGDLEQVHLLHCLRWICASELSIIYICLYL